MKGCWSQEMRVCVRTRFDSTRQRQKHHDRASLSVYELGSAHNRVGRLSTIGIPHAFKSKTKNVQNNNIKSLQKSIPCKWSHDTLGFHFLGEFSVKVRRAGHFPTSHKTGIKLVSLFTF